MKGQENYRIAIAQLNQTVGDLRGNCKKILEYIEMAESLDVDIISFPELAITGYPPEDLLLKQKFIDDNIKSLKELSSKVPDIVSIIGFVDTKNGDIYNAASVIYNGEIKGVYHKMLLPNYGVFDEKRYFTGGRNPLVFKYRDLTFGVSICEDIWRTEGPTTIQAENGAKLIFNINASPYHAGKIKIREDVVRKIATENRVYVVYANLVGGQDEIVFDGQSMVMDSKGDIIARALPFKEDLLMIDLQLEDILVAGAPIKIEKQKITAIKIGGKIKKQRKINLIQLEHRPLEPVEEVYSALALGLYDYVAKNGFKKVVLGLSGGIDSALVATIAADTLGKENVIGVLMPSRFTSDESKKDAKKLAGNLGIRLISVPIDNIFKAYLSTLKGFFEGQKVDITEENIQARIRGNILMAFSNKFNWLVLTTGNKSEMSVGYATLYGDMAGGFAVIKDVPKTLVYKLCEFRNSKSHVIPENILKKEPTAELRHNQKDTDTLPPYNMLDPILKLYIEDDINSEKISLKGIGKGTIEKVLKMVDNSEYKRRQSPPGIKITPKAFGKDRRMPITNKYKG